MEEWRRRRLTKTCSVIDLRNVSGVRKFLSLKNENSESKVDIHLGQEVLAIKS
jgi:hypothetical protein